MDISERGIRLIQEFEGKHKLLSDGRYKAYLDTLAKPPVWTIYCGLTRGVHEGMICTTAEGDKFFAKELAIYEDAVERLIDVELNQNMFDALTSFTYNCGVGALENSTLRRVLNQGKYEQVPAQLMRWVHAGGKEWAGLVRRRKAEGALFLEPMQEEIALPPLESEDVVAPQMPQRVEEGPAGSTNGLVRDSKTIQGVLAAALAYIAEKGLGVYEFLFGIAKDAGPEIMTLKTTLSPFEPLFKIGLPTVVIVGLAVAWARRRSARIEGREG
jgi:lysozyme